MNRAQATRLLADLGRHFGEPVLPVSRYCAALRAWVKQIELLNEGEPRLGHGARYHALLGRILVDIRKSNLLWRMIYAGEPLRTQPCPEHKGKHHGGYGCAHGCGESGWLPEPTPPGDLEVVVLDLVETRGHVSPVAFTTWLALQGYAPFEPERPLPHVVLWMHAPPLDTPRGENITLPRAADDPTWPRSIETALAQIAERTQVSAGTLLRQLFAAPYASPPSSG